MSDLLDGSEYEIILGDCIKEMHSLPVDQFDLSVFSPPFASLFAYSSEIEDIGNTHDDDGEFRLTMSFFFRQLLRVMKPGRMACCHISNVILRKRTFGRQGLRDLRGLMIRIAERAGFWFHGEAGIQRNPQSEAIRTKSSRLLFVRMESNHLQAAPATADYVLFFKKPGDSAVPVTSPVERNEWISWAHPFWYDIRQTNTLNVRGTKGPEDVKHICPLQLDVINRCVRLYSNAGEIVFSPFAGIGSEGVKSLELDRRFYGVELKREYHEEAIRNVNKAIERRSQKMSLFAGFEATVTSQTG